METIKTIGIIGSGKMGEDIFNFLCENDFYLVWVTKNEKEVLFERFIKRITRKLKAGIITELEHKEIFDRNKITEDFNDLSNCDLILETITEDFEMKKEVFNELEKIAGKDAVIATNSSSIVPSKLVNNEMQKRLIGLHFFYPIKLKDVIEVIINKNTDPGLLNKISIFLFNLNRFYIKLDEKNAFILNKILLVIQAYVYNYYENNNLSFIVLDELVRKHLFPIGIFEMIDNIGVSTLLTSIKNYLTDFDENDRTYFMPLIKRLENMIENNNEQEFYKIRDNRISLVISEKIEEKFINGLIYIYINACYKVLENKILTEHELSYSIKEYFGTTKNPFEIVKEIGKEEFTLICH